jgi:hypothetical protein
MARIRADTHSHHNLESEGPVRKHLLVVVLLAFLTAALPAQVPSTVFVGLGDSIGEAVQSGDASYRTQPYSFLNLIALLMGVPFPQPYIQSGLLGQVGSMDGRSRIYPTVPGLNLAVSGADTFDLLFTRPDAATTAAIDSETDLVLYPRLASQIEIAESLHPQIVACWIGNNDALASVTAFDQLDGVSNLTPLAEFQANFQQIAARLAALNSKVVFGTIPDVTRIGYLINRSDLIRLTGQDYGLPDGVYTTIVTTFGLRLGLIDPIVLTQPNFILDQSEVANISLRISQFNDVIRATAAQHGMGVADTHAAFEILATNPPVLFGVPLRTRFLGGIFSLDGVHPSNVGQLLVARLFIETFNYHYGMTIQNVTTTMMGSFFFNDPFIDKDGDGRVKGRLGAGMLETVAPLIGWAGDNDDAVPTAPTALSSEQTALAVETLERETGRNLRGATHEERLDAIGAAFGIKRGKKK